MKSKEEIIDLMTAAEIAGAIASTLQDANNAEAVIGTLEWVLGEKNNLTNHLENMRKVAQQMRASNN